MAIKYKITNGYSIPNISQVYGGSIIKTGSSIAHSTGGKILINGLNSYALVPVGTVSNFETRFNYLWLTNIASYPTITDVANSIQAAEDRVDTILDGYTTSNELSVYVDNNVGAAVTQEFGSYVTKSGAAASMYSISVEAGDIAAGFKIGALSDNETSTSFFKIMADKFAIYGQVNNEVDANGDPVYGTPLDINGDPAPAFAISNDNGEYQINFNGKVIFENLLNGSGQTVVNGDRLLTNYIEVGQPAGQSASIGKHIGAYIDDATADLYAGTINEGDTYLNTTDNAIMYRVGTSWSSIKGKLGSNLFSKTIFKVGAVGTTPLDPVGGTFTTGGVYTPPLGWTEDKPFVAYEDGTVYESTIWYIYDPEAQTTLPYNGISWSTPINVGSAAPIKGVDFFDGNQRFTEFAYSLSSLTPSGGSFNGSTFTYPTTPTQWYDTPQEVFVDEQTQIYQSEAVADYDSATATWTVGTWSVPAKWNGLEGQDGADGSAGTVSVDVNYEVASDTQANSIIFNVAGRTGAVGDTIWNISATNGTIKSYYGTSGWTHNVGLHINGNAIVSGTLQAGDIQSGGTISGNAIKGASAWFSGSGLFLSSTVFIDGTSAGVGLTVRGGASNIVRFETGSGNNILTVSDAFGIELTRRLNVLSSGTAATISSSSGVGLSSTGSGWGGSGVIGNANSAHGINGSTSAGATPYAGVYGNNTGSGKGVIGNAPSSKWGIYTAQKSYAYLGYNSPVTTISFTGGHTCFSTENLIVGDILDTNSAKLFTVDQSYTFVSTASTAMSKKVFGIVSKTDDDVEVNLRDNPLTCIEDIDSDGTTIYTTYKPEVQPYIDMLVNGGYKDVVANALGEGGINVCSIGGDIENGDYITSSIVKGKGMKQSDDILHNYTAAKSLADVVWSGETVGIDGCYSTIGSDGNSYKTKLIPCTYHSG